MFNERMKRKRISEKGPSREKLNLALLIIVLGLLSIGAALLLTYVSGGV